MRVLAILREFGHLVGATPLLRAIARCGHEVVVLATSGELARLAADQALASLVVELPPARTRSTGLDDSLVRESERRGGEVEYDWRAVFAPFELAIVDGTLPTMLLAAVRHHLGVIVVNTQLSYARRGATPPVTMPIVDDAERAWRAVVAHRSARAAEIDRAVERGAVHRAVSLAFLAAESAALGLADRVTYGCASTLLHWTGFPEITLVPQGFDLPGSFTSDRHHYVGSQPALASEARYERRDGLVYCAFGSQAGNYPPAELRHRVDLLASLMRRRPELFLALQVPAELGARVAGITNIEARPFWPQARVLEAARAFITHSGMAGIAEALRHRVPMLAHHVTSDQPGNAARIAYHGIGVLLSEWTAGALEARLDAALAIPRDLLAAKARAWFPAAFDAEIAALFPRLADVALAERR